MPDIILPGSAGRIEARYQRQKNPGAPMALVLHPHPQFGGTMNNPLVYDLSKEPYPSGKVTRQEIPVRNGLKQEDAKKVVKLIKDSGLKVQPAIMDDLVRVTAKKIDDLQAVIKLCTGANLGIALQYVNMRS